MPAPEEFKTHNGQNGHNMNGTKEHSAFSQTDANKSFIFSLLVNLSKMWRNWSGTIDQVLEQYGAYEIIDWIVQHLSRHPFLAFGMSMCVLSFALPFIIFMVFAIATVIMTFTGFVIIEGTLITLASALLFGFLGSVMIFFLFSGFVMMAAYFGLVQIYEFVDYPSKRRAITQYFCGKPSKPIEKLN